MIVQKINLYQAQFKEQKVFASSTQIIALLLVMLFGIAGWSYKLNSDLAAFQEQARLLKVSQASINSELTKAPIELNKQLADNRIKDSIKDITAQLKARRLIIRFVENNQLGSGEGFSAYLKSLADLQVEGVWLDEIILSNSSLKIRGSALSADLIPIYFASFSEEAVFRGQRFQLFELDRKSSSDWKVDFTIATETSFAKN